MAGVVVETRTATVAINATLTALGLLCVSETGWFDSKRTGKVGWSALWEGWFKLEHMIEGAELAASLPQ